MVRWKKMCWLPLIVFIAVFVFQSCLLLLVMTNNFSTNRVKITNQLTWQSRICSVDDQARACEWLKMTKNGIPVTQVNYLHACGVDPFHYRAASPYQHPNTQEQPDSNKEETVNDITIVTAYFNLGNFYKESKKRVVGTQSYIKWMDVYSRIINPVVAIFDDEKIFNYFKDMRSKSARKTRAFLVKRGDLWSFQMRNRIKAIFQTPGYPKYFPNTAIPDYSCAMHAKFEILLMAAVENIFGTKYIGWLDIGLFRFDTQNDTFGLWLPPKFDAHKVSYTEVYEIQKSRSLKEIIEVNRVWVSGAMNLGTMDVMRNFSRDYLRFVNYSLDNNLISTDEQIIYGMYTDNVPESVKPSVRLQTYNKGPGDPYFRLGYICRQAWMAKKTSDSQTITQ